MIRHLLFTLVVLLTPLVGICQAFDVQTDRPRADYSAGETAEFRVTYGGQGELRYKIRHSLRTAPLEEGTLDHTGGTTVVRYSFPQPAFITFEAFLNGEYKAVAATFSKESIQPLSPEPADFDAFWQAQKAELASVPMDIVDWQDQRNDHSTTYQFSLGSVDGRRVHGYVVVPDGDGPFPATLRLPAFGSGRNLATPDVASAERTNCIGISITIHNAPPDQEDWNAYEPNDITSPEGIYYRYAVLGAIRALDYLESSYDKWNGEELCIYGDSQGGGLAMLVAGIDRRPTHLIQSVAALSHHAGLRFDRPSGFPYYLESANALYSNEPDKIEEVFNAIKYYDAAYAIRRFEGPSLHYANFLDDVCPPETAYAAFNQLRGPKVVLHTLDAYHSNVREFVDDRRDFIRLHFEAANNPPFPFESERKSHFIDAGEQFTAVTDSLIRLNPTYTYDGQIGQGWIHHWAMIEGPSSAVFEQSSSPVSRVSFPDTGRYVLRLTTIDPYPAEESKWWTLIDEVEVYVSQRTTSGSNDISRHGLKKLTIGPNPSSRFLSVEAALLEPGTFTLSLSDLHGKVLFRRSFLGDEHREELDLKDYINGIYTLSVTTDKGQVSKSVVLKK